MDSESKLTGTTFSVLPPVFHNYQLRIADPEEFEKQFVDGIKKLDEEYKDNKYYVSFLKEPNGE